VVQHAADYGGLPPGRTHLQAIYYRLGQATSRFELSEDVQLGQEDGLLNTGR
jgi:hypothetical protein